MPVEIESNTSTLCHNHMAGLFSTSVIQSGSLRADFWFRSFFWGGLQPAHFQKAKITIHRISKSMFWCRSVRCVVTDLIQAVGVARILSGVHFFGQKSWRPFFNCRPQRPSKYTSKSKPPSKNCPKIDSCSGWGCTSCPGGALTHFSCKLGFKIFFHRPGGAGAPTAPPGYAYEWLRLWVVQAV